jgi:hypothetical protein
MSPQMQVERTVRSVPLSGLKIDPAAQVRQKCSAGVVKTYAQAMYEQKSDGVWCFPPVLVFDDGAILWLGDGRQRCLAAVQAGLSEIIAEIRPGSERDALLFAITANTDHGLPRTIADKRKAVSLLLADTEWSAWSDREIARRCQVGSAPPRGVGLRSAQGLPPAARADLRDVAPRRRRETDRFRLRGYPWRLRCLSRFCWRPPHGQSANHTAIGGSADRPATLIRQNYSDRRSLARPHRARKRGRCQSVFPRFDLRNGLRGCLRRCLRDGWRGCLRLCVSLKPQWQCELRNGLRLVCV